MNELMIIVTLFFCIGLLLICYSYYTPKSIEDMDTFIPKREHAPKPDLNTIVIPPKPVKPIPPRHSYTDWDMINKFFADKALREVIREKEQHPAMLGTHSYKKGYCNASY